MPPDDTTHQDRLKRNGAAPGLSGILQAKDDDGEQGEAASLAFGYLRGIKDSAAAVEFRLRSGNSWWFPYNSMGPWQYNPSEGLLLKFSSDVVYLVLIRGSNLAKPLNEGTINLTHAGLQRHRVLFVREMSDEEIRKVGDAGPTIDAIEIAQFESNGDLQHWVREHAPGFLHGGNQLEG